MAPRRRPLARLALRQTLPSPNINSPRQKQSVGANGRRNRLNSRITLRKYRFHSSTARHQPSAVANWIFVEPARQNNLAGDVLTENPAVGRSYMSANRVRPDHYKGMPPDEQMVCPHAALCFALGHCIEKTTCHRSLVFPLLARPSLKHRRVNGCKTLQKRQARRRKTRRPMRPWSSRVGKAHTRMPRCAPHVEMRRAALHATTAAPGLDARGQE